MPARVKCAVLGWHTLEEAFKQENKNRKTFCISEKKYHFTHLQFSKN